MNYRRLGKTNLKVSEIGLGCWAIGGLTTINSIPLTYGNINEKTATNIINTALKLGINTFDTADSYSLGNSEKRLGRALNENRKTVNIFTKAGIIPSFTKPLPVETDLSYQHLISSINRSLIRLNTKQVELFQAHKAPKSEKDFKDIERAFVEIKKEGKALFCGVSIGLEYKIGIELIERGIVDTIQMYFSLLDFKAHEELLPLAKKRKVGIIVAEPLSQGFLSGKYELKHKFDKTDIRKISYNQKQIKDKIKKVMQLQFLVNKKRTMSQASISYILNQKEISTCIPGSKSIKHVISNAAASKIKLTSDELKHIKEIQEKWSNQ